MNLLLAPPRIQLLYLNQQQPTTQDVWSKQSYNSYRKTSRQHKSQHDIELISLPINHQTDSSSATTTQNSNNNQYHITTANDISAMLKIDTKKIHEQQNKIR